MTPPALPRRRLLVLLTTAATLASCASPDPTFYTLAAVPGMARPPGSGSIKLRRIGLAGYLDRAQIVRTGGDYRLALAAGERWGEPLGDMIGRILTEDLTQRLPGRTVFTAAGSLTTSSDVNIEIDLQRFDADPADVVTLLAQVAVEPAQGNGGATEVFRLTAPAGSSATPAIVGTMSRLLGELADRIATMPGIP